MINKMNKHVLVHIKLSLLTYLIYDSMMKYIYYGQKQSFFRKRLVELLVVLVQVT